MTLYFAYGSNLNLAKFFTRCPTAQLVGPATLEGWKLRFAGQGHADIVPAEEDDEVPGVLYKCDRFCMKSLDRYEGVSYNKKRKGYYKRKVVNVVGVDGSDVAAIAYVMTKGHTPEEPSDYYLNEIVVGIHQWEIDFAPAVLDLCIQRGYVVRGVEKED